MTALSQVPAGSLCEAWNATCDPLAKYRLDPEILAINLHESPLLHTKASMWDEGPFVAIKRNASCLYSGPDPETAHVSLLAGPTGARPLLRNAMDVLREEGVRTLVFGMDSGHFFPGVPEDLPWIGTLLAEHGFVGGGLSYDLECDLTAYVPPGGLIGANFRLLNKDDVAELTTFLQREFPGRWCYDVLRKIEAEGPQTVFGLFVEDRCEGFALLQQEGCRLPIGGAVWRKDLGARWGSLGPIGISKELRGRGLGNALLGRGLEALQARGTRNTIIDWTGLIEFYGGHGFNVARFYRSFRVDLAEAQRS